MANWQTDNQGKPNNVDIKAVLLEVIKGRAQHAIEDENENGQPLEETGNPARKNKGAAAQESSAEGSRKRKGKAKVNSLSKFRLFWRN